MTQPVFGDGVSLDDLPDLPDEFRPKVVAATGEVPAHVDFFAADDTAKHYLPDGVQHVVLKALTEGDRRRYLSKINQEIRMNAQTKEMRVKGNAGEDTQALLEAAIVDWLIYRDGKPLRFESRTLVNVIESFPPSIVLGIEKKIREMNPWLRGEDDIETLQQEIDDLTERLQQAKDRAAKN